MSRYCAAVIVAATLIAPVACSFASGMSSEGHDGAQLLARAYQSRAGNQLPLKVHPSAMDQPIGADCTPASPEEAQYWANAGWPREYLSRSHEALIHGAQLRVISEGIELSFSRGVIGVLRDCLELGLTRQFCSNVVKKAADKAIGAKASQIVAYERMVWRDGRKLNCAWLMSPQGRPFQGARAL